eukprot:10747865-Lingulodinium_polyedra.AAC.1
MGVQLGRHELTGRTRELRERGARAAVRRHGGVWFQSARKAREERKRHPAELHQATARGRPRLPGSDGN